ncbi:MAG: acyl-CoA dehydrogenase family protein [Acidimicrobiales bacterium]
MEFRLDEGQVDLQETVARFCAARYPLDGVVAREGAPLDRAVWSELAELGVLGLLAAEAEGGSGLGALEAAIVFEQLGAHLVPGPLLWSVLAAGRVAGAATGDVVVGGVAASDVVDGTALVEHAADLDVLIVVHDDAVVSHRANDLPAPVALEPVDPLTPVSRVRGLTGGEAIGDAAAAGRLRRLGTVLSAALLTGLAHRSLEVARAYALERQQFDAPIGSFQAVKHLLADMYVRGGLAQSATYAAAAVLQDPGPDDPVRAASVAKLLASEAAITNASTAIQVLGGMGFTWDMLPNHLLKRAWVLEHTFGAADDHATSIGSALVAAGGGT